MDQGTDVQRQKGKDKEEEQEEEKYVPVSLRPPKIPHDRAWDWSPASSVRNMKTNRLNHGKASSGTGNGNLENSRHE